MSEKLEVFYETSSGEIKSEQVNVDCKSFILTGREVSSIDIGPLFLCQELTEIRLPRYAVLRADSVFRFFPRVRCMRKSLEDNRIEWLNYLELSSREDWSKVIRRLKKQVAITPENLWFVFQRGFFEVFGFGELAGYDGNPCEIINPLLETLDYAEAKEHIYDRMIELLEVQLERGGPTFLLDVDRMSETRAARLVPQVLELRRIEIENVVVAKINTFAYLLPLWFTAWGYEILHTLGFWFATKAYRLTEVRKLLKPLGLKFRTKNIECFEKIEFPQFSAGVQEFILNLITESSKISIKLARELCSVEPLMSIPPVQSSIGKLIESSDEYLNLIRLVSSVESLSSSAEIQRAIIKVIKSSKTDESWRVIESTVRAESLINNSEFRQTIVEAFETAVEPHRVIGAIPSWLTNDNEFQESLAEVIESAKKPDLIFAISLVEEIIQSDVIQRAVINVIESSKTPYLPIIYALRIESLTHRVELQDAIVRAIRFSDEPWNVVRAIHRIELFTTNPEIRNAISEMSEGIGRGIGAILEDVQDRVWSSTGYHDDAWDRGDREDSADARLGNMIPVLLFAIEVSEEPWGIIEPIFDFISTMANVCRSILKFFALLLENAEIRNVITADIPRLVSKIEQAHWPNEIIKYLIQIEIIRENQHIIDVVRQARLYDRYYGD